MLSLYLGTFRDQAFLGISLQITFPVLRMDYDPPTISKLGFLLTCMPTSTGVEPPHVRSSDHLHVITKLS